MRVRPDTIFVYDSDLSLLSCTIEIDNHYVKITQELGENLEDFYDRCRLTVRLMVTSLTGNITT